VLDRHDLTEAEWTRLEPLLPDRAPRRGGRWADHQQVINGVFWRTRCGVPWRDLPPQYGHWKTVYHRHRRWSGDGTWERILEELRRDADTAEGAAWAVAIDSGTVRAHQHAAGARRTPPADIPAEVLAPLELDTGGGVESQESGPVEIGAARP
jgi:transposase